MSRSCNDCNLDGLCDMQRNGTIACYDGDDKTKEQRIKDIDNKVLKVIDDMQNIMKQYCSWNLFDEAETISKANNIVKERYVQKLIEDEYGWHKPEDKLPEENQECVIEIEYANKLNTNDIMYNQHEVKYINKFWIGKYENVTDCYMKVIRWRVK